MAVNDDKALVPPPGRPAITFRGQRVTPWMVVELFKSAQRARRESRRRILLTRAFRRKEASSKVRVEPAWARQNPQAAAVATLTCEERVTLERNLIATIGNVEPEYEREPLGFRDTDRDAAEACQAYLEEWRQRDVPAPVFVGKQTEDGEHALVVLPTDLDFEGAPEYFEYLTDADAEKLNADERDAYTVDEDDRRGRLVRRDQDGNRVPKRKYREMLAEPDEDKEKPAAERQSRKEDRAQAAEQAHKEDVAQYILRKQLKADAIRVVPALECAPVFARGRGRDRWELVALVERVLYERWELLDAREQYRWVGMGDRRLVPQGYREDGTTYEVSSSDVGVGDKVYVYTAYLPVREKDDEGVTRSHLLVCTTIGGAGTWDAASGNEHDPNSVSVIDLYDEYGVEGERGGLWPFVTYHGGLHTEDDDADHYYQPYLWALLDRLKGIEMEEGAIRATVSKVAFTGHMHTPDPRWASTEDGAEFLLETDGELRVPKIPGPGQVETSVGSLSPVQQAEVGQGAWRMLEVDRQRLAEATAVDQVPGGKGSSGYALLMQSTISQVAKKQIRDGVKGAVIACGEAHLRILHAIYTRWRICWPQRTVQERPASAEGEDDRSGRALALYDPVWVADGQFNLAASYPEEENLARIDLEASLAERGFGSFDDVQRARAKQNSDLERQKADRDRLLKTPQADILRLQRIAKKMNDRELQRIVALQAEQLMSPVDGLPGMGGIPNAALRGPGEGGGGRSIATNVRAGVEGGIQRGEALAAEAQTALGGAAA